MNADEPSIDWQPLAAALQPWPQKAAIVLTPNDLQALYYLDEYDVAVNPSRLSEVNGRAEFSLDPRTGLPVVSRPGSLELILPATPTASRSPTR